MPDRDEQSALRAENARLIALLESHGIPVSNEAIFAVLAWMMLFGAAAAAMTLLMLATDLPFDIAFAALMASLNDIGPAVNHVGPAGTYQPLTDFQTWICTAAMLLGRLELLSVLVLFTAHPWRD